MKKLFIILFAITLFFWIANISHWNIDKLYVERACKAIISPSTLKSSLKIKNNFAPNCTYWKAKIQSEETFTWDFSKSILSTKFWECNRRADWWYECDMRCNSPEVKVEVIAKMKKSELFPNFVWIWLPKLTWTVEYKIIASWRRQLESILWIWESPEIFTADIPPTTSEFDWSCNVTCTDLTIQVPNWKDKNGKTLYKTIVYDQSVDRTCWYPNIKNQTAPDPNSRTEDAKIWISVTDKDCISTGDKSYSCYAKDSYEMELVVEKAGRPGPIKFLRTYILEPGWETCLGWVSDCHPLDIDISWSGKFQYTWFPEWTLTKDWKYTLEFNWVVWSKSRMDNRSEPEWIDIKIVPNPEWLIWEVEKEEWEKSYANFTDSFKYETRVIDKYKNPIREKTVISMECMDWCIPDRATTKWIVAKWFWKNPNDKEWKNKFEIVSAVPNEQTWAVKPIFEWKYKKWNPNYQDIDWEETKFEIESKVEKVYQEPILYDKMIVEGIKPDIAKTQKYEFKLKNVWSLRDYANWTVSSISTSTIYLNSDYKFENWLSELDEFFWENVSDNVWFKAKIKAKEDLKILWIIEVHVRNLFISYDLNKEWKRYQISYPLRQWKDKKDFLALEWCTRGTVWLQINWIAQSKGKSEDASSINTFANTDKTELKKNITKNAYDLTRNLTNNKSTNWIYFVDLTKSVNKTVSYKSVKWNLKTNDSLIIKWWNLFIDENIETSIWIAVFSGNTYDAEKNNKVWNVYVKNDVSKINAYIYSDWWFISANSNGSRYSEDELRNKLILNWSLFSSNTIWGWEEWDTWCKLPWNRATKDCDLAEKYDLNHIRDTFLTCGPSDYSFKIEYNPLIQSNPPKVFVNK